MEGNDEKRARSESNDDEVVAKRHREEEEEQLSQDAIDLVDDQELLEEPLEDPVFGALAAVQNELELLNDEAAEQALQVEQHFIGRRKPVYARRNQVIKGLDKFWQISLSQHPALKDAMTTHDYTILGYCTEVDVEDHNDVGRGFKITFRFESCPHFTNTELVKVFTYMEDDSMQIQSSLPVWCEGYEPGDENDAIQGNMTPEYLFFNWFKTTAEELPAGEHDEIANIIKDEIWPNPLKFYIADFGDEVQGGEGEDEEFEGNGTPDGRVPGEDEYEQGEEDDLEQGDNDVQELDEDEQEMEDDKGFADGDADGDDNDGQ